MLYEIYILTGICLKFTHNVLGVRFHLVQLLENTTFHKKQ